MLIDFNIQVPLPRLEILESGDASCDLICQVGVVVVVVFSSIFVDVLLMMI